MQTNAAYHADSTHLSSSGLKLLLKDPSQFYAQYVLGQRMEQEKAHFTEGSFVHASILEPETLKSRFAVYPGLIKRGKAWEEFKEVNMGKELLSASQELRCNRLIAAFKNMPTAMQLLKTTKAEHTMTSTIMDVQVKARADAISSSGYMLDIKTTSMPTDIDFFRQTIQDYAYDLSASLYAAIASSTYGTPFEFYWVVLSNVDNGCAIYRASEQTMRAGAAKYTQALVLYKQCKSTGVWSTQNKNSFEPDENYEILEV